MTTTESLKGCRGWRRELELSAVSVFCEGGSNAPRAVRAVTRKNLVVVCGEHGRGRHDTFGIALQPVRETARSLERVARGNGGEPVWVRREAERISRALRRAGELEGADCRRAWYGSSLIEYRRLCSWLREQARTLRRPGCGCYLEISGAAEDAATSSVLLTVAGALGECFPRWQELVVVLKADLESWFYVERERLSSSFVALMEFVTAREHVPGLDRARFVLLADESRGDPEGRGGRRVLLGQRLRATSAQPQMSFSRSSVELILRTSVDSESDAASAPGSHLGKPGADSTWRCAIEREASTLPGELSERCVVAARQVTEDLRGRVDNLQMSSIREGELEDRRASLLAILDVALGLTRADTGTVPKEVAGCDMPVEQCAARVAQRLHDLEAITLQNTSRATWALKIFRLLRESIAGGVECSAKARDQKALRKLEQTRRKLTELRRHSGLRQLLATLRRQHGLSREYLESLLEAHSALQEAVSGEDFAGLVEGRLRLVAYRKPLAIAEEIVRRLEVLAGGLPTSESGAGEPHSSADSGAAAGSADVGQPAVERRARLFAAAEDAVMHCLATLHDISPSATASSGSMTVPGNLLEEEVAELRQELEARFPMEWHFDRSAETWVECCILTRLEDLGAVAPLRQGYLAARSAPDRSLHHSFAEERGLWQKLGSLFAEALPVRCGNAECSLDIAELPRAERICPGCNRPIRSRCGNEGCEENFLHERKEHSARICPVCSKPNLSAFWRCPKHKEWLPCAEEVCPDCLLGTTARPHRWSLRSLHRAYTACPQCLERRQRDPSWPVFRIADQLAPYVRRGVRLAEREKVRELADLYGLPNSLCCPKCHYRLIPSRLLF
ncbi:MAG: hypothetical protein U0002_17035 [Thermoanaerobaculia bacterium]